MSSVSLYGSPLFEPLRPWLDHLPPAPDARAVAELAVRYPIETDHGQPIRFVPPRPDGQIYECRIWESGEVETRPDNWHDFFNALVWLSFPKTKNAVSAAHVRAMQAPGEARGTVRDALTHFDECGIVVLSTEPELLDLLRDFRWRELFVERRAEVIGCMRFVIFGHAMYEQLLKPFRGLTAKAVLYEVTADWLQLDGTALRAAVDDKLAADLTSGRYTRPRDFQPLPLLGIPGVTPDSEDPAYYDDTWQFRPGRRSATTAAA
ncbi:DUF3025 domain-containing protein [Dechloromonas sp. HYN0024]|uniref:DUF3025 domain-containing protein n=1 Tax=Dechloromonas sp. HYN0024 TaxID=2231055 RepID=UPI000E42EB0F|nr:DUF3025 domain-containing protein [Dechloromonas sp. HYN0024]AXS78943.1 DUF3025 domain-containing protein [Dechloromonas sp. HYN0024]